MTAKNGYQITNLDRAMAQRISSHTGISEIKILRSIVISKEHVKIVRQRAIKEGRLGQDGLPLNNDPVVPLRLARVS